MVGRDLLTLCLLALAADAAIATCTVASDNACNVGYVVARLPDKAFPLLDQGPGTCGQGEGKFLGRCTRVIYGSLVLTRLSNGPVTQEQVDLFINEIKGAFQDFDNPLVEPDHRFRAAGPTDEWFLSQWGLQDNDKPADLCATTHSASTIDVSVVPEWESAFLGENVLVAIVDSGTALGTSVASGQLQLRWQNSGEFGADEDHNKLVGDRMGWDFVDWDGVPQDEYGHGIAVEGIVFAAHDQVSVAGMAPRATLMSLRVLDDDGNGCLSAIVGAVDYATAHGAQIVNLSLETSKSSCLLRDSLESKPDTLFVAAAGNSGCDLDDPEKCFYYPAKWQLDNLLVVTSHGVSGTFRPQANRGKKRVHIAAPGDCVLSLYQTGLNACAGQVEDLVAGKSPAAVCSGTSFAAPFATGAAALWLSEGPASPGALILRAVQTAVTENSLAQKVVSGGRLRVRKPT